MDNKSNVSEEEVSPTVSRFGRMRKPKISTDFCDIDEIIQIHEQAAKIAPKVIKTVKQTSLLKPVKKLQVAGVKNLTIQKDLDIYMNAPKQITPLKTEQASNKLKLVKISGDLIKNRKFFKSKPTENAELEDSIDVSKVMKLVVGKSGEQQPQIKKPISGFQKNLIKTYGNKRRVFNRPSLESFGLPDEPIIPIIDSKVTKPKRIQSLDVGKASRDVTLIDSKVNSQWQTVNTKGSTIPKFSVTQIAKPATKTTQDTKIAKKIDDNLRTKKFDLTNVIKLNFNTLQRNVIPEQISEDTEVIELDDDDDDDKFGVLPPSAVSTPRYKNIIIHSNELVTPAKKLPPKVKILEDIIFKNSSTTNNNLDKQKLKMSNELETVSSDQQLFNLEYVNEAPVEDLMDENVIEEMTFDSSKDNILETDSHSLPIDSDSICSSSMSVENLSFPNENTIITFSPDFPEGETVVPAFIDEESYCEEPFDGNEETVFTTVDNNIICPPGQESPVLILIKEGDENIIIESSVEEVEDVNISTTSESKDDDEEAGFEESDFNIQIDLETSDGDHELKISEEDGDMIVLDENLVSQLGEGYIILQGNLDNKDTSSEELAQIAILDPNLKDEMEEGTQYILQCTATEDLEELVIQTSADESQILPEESEIEKDSTFQETVAIKKNPVDESENNNSNSSEKQSSAVVEHATIPDDNLSINRKSYKLIREKIRLEAKNLLQSKGTTNKSLDKQSKPQILNKNIYEEAKSPSSNIRTSPKRNKSTKQQEVLPNKVTTTYIEGKDKSAKTPAKSAVKVKEESIQLESPKKKKTFNKSSTDFKNSPKQNKSETLESPTRKKSVQKEGQISDNKKDIPKPETPRTAKIGKEEKAKNEIKKVTTPGNKKLINEYQEECKSPGKTKVVREYKKSSDEMKLVDSLNETEKLTFSEDIKRNISRRTNVTSAEENNSLEEMIKSPTTKTEKCILKTKPNETARFELKRGKVVVETSDIPEEITKSNKPEEFEKFINKKENKVCTEENDKTNTERTLSEQNKIKPEILVNTKTESTESNITDKIGNVKFKNEAILSEGDERKIESPSKRRNRSNDRNIPERTKKPQNHDEHKNILETKDEPVKLKPSEESNLGTSINVSKKDYLTTKILTEEIPRETSVKSPNSKLKLKNQNRGGKSLKSPQEEIKVDHSSKQNINQKSMDDVKPKDISFEQTENKLPLSEKEHQPEKANRGKSFKAERREVSPEKRKNSPKDKEPVVSQDDESMKSLIQNTHIEGKRKSLRSSHSEDHEQKVESSKISHTEILHGEEIKEKRKSLRYSQLKDQEPKITSQIEITETLSDKAKKQQVVDDSDMKDKTSSQKRKSTRFLQSKVQEQILSSTVVAPEVSSLKDKEQQHEKEIKSETSSEAEEKLQTGLEILRQHDEFKEKVTLEKRKSSRLSHPKESESKVTTSETSVEKRKSQRILPPEQEHQAISQSVTPDDSSEKYMPVTEVTNEKVAEKRKSSRIYQPKEENLQGNIEIINEHKKSPTIKDHKYRETSEDIHKNSKEEKDKSISKECVEESQNETSPGKKRLKTAKQQDQFPSTSSNEETLPNSQKTSPSKEQICKERTINIEEKQMKIDTAITSDYVDKRKSTRLSQNNSQDHHLTLVHSASPDKRKSSRFTKDSESINQENTGPDNGRKSKYIVDMKSMQQETEIEVRKTRSGKDFDPAKQDTKLEINKKTKSDKYIGNLKQENNQEVFKDKYKPLKAMKGLDQENILPEVPGISRTTRSAKDLEGIKQENIPEGAFDSKKSQSDKDIEAINIENANADSLEDKRKSSKLVSPKDTEPSQIEEFSEERRKSSRISLTNINDEKLGVKRLLSEDPKTITLLKEGEDEKEKLESAEHKQKCNKDIEVQKNSSNKKVLSGKEIYVNESEKNKSNKDIEGLTIKKISEDKKKSPKKWKVLSVDLSLKNKITKAIDGHMAKRISEWKKKLQSSPKKLKEMSVDEVGKNKTNKEDDCPMSSKISEGKKKLQSSPKKLKEISTDESSMESNEEIKSPSTKKISEGKKNLQSSPKKWKSNKMNKEPKIVVRLKNIHNKWTHTKNLDKTKQQKSDNQKMRHLRSKFSENSSPRKDSPKKRKAEQFEHKERKQLHLRQRNKSHENRRSARVSELKPVSYNEHTKSSGGQTAEKSITTNNSLKDIMDDVEYIKRAMLNSSQVDTTDKKETVDEHVTKVTIKEEIVDDENVENPFLCEIDNIKKEIKEEPLDDDLSKQGTVKQEHIFNDGDLAYAKLGHFPYWPCLITQEPDTKRYTNLKVNNVMMYHVRFFGDKGRRSWVRSKHVLPLKSKDDLHIIYSKLKKQGIPRVLLHAYNPNPKTYQMWEVGLKEALSLLDKTIKERYEFFFNMFASEQEKIKKSLRNSPIYQESIKVEIKTEELDEVAETTMNKSSNNKLKKPKYSKSPIGKLKSREIDNETEEPVRRKRGKAIQKEPEEDDDVIEVKTGTSTPELKKTHLSIIDLSSECSLSDTDSSSRWSIRTPIVCTNENQSALYKRNSLFKKVQRDKVCQKCLKPGEIFKCRGKCFGYYHKECSMFKVKVNVDEEENDSDCQIVLVKDKKYNNFKKLTLSTDKSFREMTLAEQIDFKLKEIMAPMMSKTVYTDSTSDYTSSEDSSSEKCTELTVEHVAADDVILVNKPMKKKKLSKSEEDFRCSKCASNMDPECFACGQDRNPSGTSSYRQKCSIIACGKFFHPECLKVWPQTQISLHSTTKHKESGVRFDSFSCPMHMCHICISDDPRASISRLSSVKIVRCLKCPATYHSNTCCIPAGTEIISWTQIICPRHLNVKGKSVKRDIINTKWCFICSEGGDLICCETCPTSVHAECSQLTLQDDDTFICEECETGRLPLYDEIVWVKLGKYRWWPALILFPNEVPENIRNMQHQHGEFVVKFFGTHDHYWVHRGRVFLFQEGDEGPGGTKRRMDKVFKKAVEEAAEAHAFKTEFKKNMEDSMKVCDKPPPYIRIKVNKPVGNVKQFDGNVSNTTPCNCNPNSESPCGPDSYCINRLLMTECDPEVCPARNKCQNQRIEKRQYPPLVPYKTKGRGWGLKTLAPIKKGEFVIEYVGEVIDDQEYQRRMAKMHEQKDDNYYFLTIDKDRMIDAGPKGNMARFMNHCCEPNCETQKWTVKGDTRVCLFAKMDIPENTEVTFNYNLESVGEEKKVCRCGAESCSGFIGVKVKNEEKKLKKVSNKIRKKRSPTPVIPVVNTEPCFYCGKDGETFPCHNKICTKYYHLKCVKLETKPDGKWSCPWHNCNLCSKRTIRCCVKCINSYCPVHSEGNVRHDKLLGFICTEHDPTKEPQEILTNIIKKPRNPATPTEESDVTSTTHEETEELLDNYSEDSSVTKLDDTFDESFDQSESPDKKKRGRPLKKKYPARKRIKLDEPHKNMNVLASSVSTPEVILTSSVPERHLRTNRKVSEDSESERLLKRQRAYEKDLPIRKRTTPRTESTENK